SGDTGQVAHEVIEGRGVQLRQGVSGQYLDGDGYVLKILLAAVGGDDDLAQFLSRQDGHSRLPRSSLGREDADAVRCEVLVAQARALEQTRERFIDAQSRGDSVRFPVT